MNFDELLDQYKANPKRENTLILLQDAQLLGYAVIFKQCQPERKSAGGGELQEPSANTWAALWECVAVDYAAIALMANDELVKAKMMVARLIGLRLVYPDGTLQELATKIITKRIMDAVV